MTQHHTPNNQHSYLRRLRKWKIVRANQWPTQRTTDQHASCSLKTGAQLVSRARSAHISIPSNVANFFKGVGQNMDVSSVASKDLQELIPLWILLQGGVQRETHQG
jgi:hypothetical protein